MKRTFLILFLCFCFLGLYAQETNANGHFEAGKLQIEKTWTELKEILRTGGFSVDKQLQVLDDFIGKYKDSKTKALYEAREMKKKIEDSPDEYARKHNLYRKGVEWLSLCALVSTHGLGLKLDLFTLKLDKFYWDIVKYEMMFWGFWGYGIIPGLHAGGFKWSTQAGVPIWITKDREIRLGTGPSWGLMRFWDLNDINTSNMFNWAFEISYLRHFKKNGAFKAGINTDFRLYSKDINYKGITVAEYFRSVFFVPHVGIFIGASY